MRKKLDRDLEKGRILEGDYASPREALYGLFQVRCPLSSTWLTIMSSDGTEECPWEHVSVSNINRCPTWEEMCWVKDLFWEPEETVIQYHPPESTYINQHPHCLHLWKPIGVELPLPPMWAVGSLGLVS